MFEYPDETLVVMHHILSLCAITLGYGVLIISPEKSDTRFHLCAAMIIVILTNILLYEKYSLDNFHWLSYISIYFATGENISIFFIFVYIARLHLLRKDIPRLYVTMNANNFGEKYRKELDAMEEDLRINTDPFHAFVACYILWLFFWPFAVVQILIHFCFKKKPL